MKVGKPGNVSERRRMITRTRLCTQKLFKARFDKKENLRDRNCGLDTQENRRIKRTYQDTHVRVEMTNKSRGTFMMKGNMQYNAKKGMLRSYQFVSVPF